eukprot:3223942-Pyramimonas_sp.AAC.1
MLGHGRDRGHAFAPERVKLWVRDTPDFNPKRDARQRARREVFDRGTAQNLPVLIEAPALTKKTWPAEL